MKVKVIYQGPAAQLYAHEYEDVAFHIDPRHGSLSIVAGNEVIVVYAAQDWRRVIDVGALAKAVGARLTAQQDTSSENPGRRKALRTIPKA